MGLIAEPAAQFTVSATDSCNVQPNAAVSKTNIFMSSVGKLRTGDEYNISLKENGKPYGPPARRLPPTVTPKVKTGVERIDESTQFCSPMVVAYRKSGDI